MKRKALYSAIALLASSGVASAASITVYGGSNTAPGSYNAPGSGYTSNLPFNTANIAVMGFNNTTAGLAGDILQSVTISYSFVYNANGVLTNAGGATVSAYASSSGAAVLADPLGTIFDNTNYPPPQQFTAYSNLLTLSSGQSTAVSLTASASGATGAITSSLSEFENNWDVNVTGATPSFAANVVGTGASSTVNNTFTGATLTTLVSVTYDYTPGSVTVPEPGSVALLAAGLAGFGIRRKANKA